MRAPQLDNRLQAVMNMVRKGSRAADVGTDHGRLALQLVLSGKCPLVYATDINEAPLAKAQKLAVRFGIEDKMMCKLTNGLQGILANEIDDVIVAGMGAETIIEIMEDAKWLKEESKRLILVPAGKQEVLRSYLFRQGFYIKEELAVEAKGRVYAVMCVVYNGNIKEARVKDVYLGDIINQHTEPARLYIEKTLRIVKEERAGREQAITIEREKQRIENGKFNLDELLALEKEIEEVLRVW